MKERILPKILLLLTTCLLLTISGFSQKKKYAVIVSDSPAYPDEDNMLLIPATNLYTIQADFMLGGSRVLKGDKAHRGFNAAVNLNYQITGVLSLCAGLSLTQMHSLSRENEIANQTAHAHQATLLSIPLGINIVLGDDRAQIVTGISILPSYYLDNHHDLPETRKFAIGLAPEYGFNFRVTRRLHIGMIGRLQLFQPYDKSDKAFPRYGFAGAGFVIRY